MHSIHPSRGGGGRVCLSWIIKTRKSATKRTALRLSSSNVYRRDGVVVATVVVVVLRRRQHAFVRASRLNIPYSRISTLRHSLVEQRKRTAFHDKHRVHSPRIYFAPSFSRV